MSVNASTVLAEAGTEREGGAKSKAASRAGAITIRLARDEADISGLISLGQVLHAESRYATYLFDTRQAGAMVRRVLAEPGRHAILIAERDGVMIGGAHVAASEFLFSTEIGATLQLLYVHPGHRGSPAAVKLLHAARRWAVLAGARELLAGVSSGIAVARTDRLMRHLGFSVVGGNYRLALPR